MAQRASRIKGVPTAHENRRAVMAQIDGFYMAKRQPDGKVNRRVVRDTLLLPWLQAHPEYLELGRVADSFLDSYEKARKPQFDVVQHTLFSPGALLVITKDIRVTMDDASRDDLVAWYQVEKQEHHGQVTAFSHKTDYLNTRLAKWRDEHPTLGAVERAVFGWTEPLVVSDDDDDTDDDTDD